MTVQEEQPARDVQGNAVALTVPPQLPSIVSRNSSAQVAACENRKRMRNAVRARMKAPRHCHPRGAASAMRCETRHRKAVLRAWRFQAASPSEQSFQGVKDDKLSIQGLKQLCT